MGTHLCKAPLQPPSTEEAWKGFWRERGQRMCRQPTCLELEGKTEQVCEESPDPIYPTQHPTPAHSGAGVEEVGTRIIKLLLHNLSTDLSGTHHCSGHIASGSSGI